MDKLYNELERILNCELELHNSVVDTATLFNTSIRNDNLPDIQTYSSLHDEQICKIDKLEEQRIEFSILISSKLGLKTKLPKLAVLIEHAPKEYKEQLSQVHVKLKKKVSELSKITISNQLLLENAMNFIDCTLAFIRKSQLKFEPYGSKKKTGQSFQTYSLINRTV
jgi:hypothetical protein